MKPVSLPWGFVFATAVVALGLVLGGCDDLTIDPPPAPTVPAGAQSVQRPDPQNLLGPGHLERAVERAAIPTCRRPMGMEVDRLGRIWVACALLGEIQVVDPESMTVLDTYGPFFEHLYTVRVVAGDRFVIAAGMGGQFVHILDMQTGRRREYIKVGQRIGDIKIIPGTTQFLVASSQEKTVTIIDAADQAIQRTVTFPEPIGYVAVSKSGDLAAATGGVYKRVGNESHMISGKVYLFNPKTDVEARLAQSLTAGRKSREPVFVKDDTLLLVPGFGEGIVAVFDTATGSLVRRLDVGEGPERIVVSPDGQFAYCLNRLSASVSVIRLSPPGVVRDIDLPAPPEHALVSPDSKFLVVTLPTHVVDGVERGNALALIDLARADLADVIPAGADPADLTQSLDGRRVYVTNFLDNSLSIFH